MIWVAWRHHRWGVLAALGTIAVAAAIMIGIRVKANGEVADIGEPGCLSSGSCTAAAEDSLRTALGSASVWFPMAFYLLPIVLGIVVGAPVFAREISQRAHVFSMSQGVSRKRWWTGNIVVTLLPVGLGILALGLISLWAWRPLISSIDISMRPGNFETFGVAPVGYFAFAYAVSATIGQLTRQNVVPIVVTIPVCVAIIITMVWLVRPAYLPPVVETVPMNATDSSSDSDDDGWVLEQVFITKDGSRSEYIPADCPEMECVAELEATGHPQDRFWTFQAMETGIYLVLTAGTLAIAARGLRTRLP